MLGRQLFYQRGPALDSAIAALQSAVDRDPTFAEAWAYLAAVARVSQSYLTVITDETALALADEASRRAIGLDQDQGLAISVRASLAQERQRWSEVFDLYNRAVKADPNSSTIRLWIGVINLRFGYLSEALVHLKRAYELDPLVGVNNGYLGMAYPDSGQDELARPRLTKAEELGYKDHFPTLAHHLMLSGSYESATSYLALYYDIIEDLADPVWKDPAVLHTIHLLSLPSPQACMLPLISMT